MPAPRWLRRALLFAPAVGCALLAALFAGAGTGSTTFACDRASGRCVWSSSSLYAGDTRSFAVDQVREVRLVTGLGKHRRDAETALVFASGHEMRLASGGEGAARARHARIDDFFAGRTSSLRDSSSGSRGLLLVSLALAVATVVLAVRAARRRLLDTVAIPAATAAPAKPWHARREVRFFLVVIAIALVGQAVLLIVADQTQGTLVLECKQRCRVFGGECLPGGSLRSSLDPGEHTIEVWTGQGPDLWRPRTFTIVLGEVTHVVCE